jgi:hypothetical protein
MSDERMCLAYKYADDLLPSRTIDIMVGIYIKRGGCIYVIVGVERLVE